MNGKSLSKGLPRWMEAPFALLGLIAMCPILGLCAMAVKLSSEGPILFRQERVGRWGKPFILFKFRTMQVNAGGPLVTAGGDSRITRIGRWLRRLKLDELTQLWNVVRGEMSLVGPRPEVPAYVDLSSPLWQEVLTARPGITDPVSLVLRNEEELNAASGADPEQFYRHRLQPYKLLGYARYLRNRTLSTDLVVLFETVLAVMFPGRTPPPSLDDIEAVLASVGCEVGDGRSME